MKKLLIILTITLFTFSSQAQGTLQFNQVVTIMNDTTFSISEYNGSGSSYVYNFNLYTVPPNKVAKLIKIDNVTSTNASGSCLSNIFQFTLNNVNIDPDKLSGIWVKGGDQMKFDAYQEIGQHIYGSSCVQNNHIFLSLIEYNIIPE